MEEQITTDEIVMENFWLQSNNGKKINLDNLKELKKSDLGNNSALLRIFNIFDTQKEDGTQGADGVLNKEELTSLFNTMATSAQTNGNSIFENEEAEAYISTTQTAEGKTLKELGLKANDLFTFLSKLVTNDEKTPVTLENLSPISLTKEQAQEQVITLLSEDSANARAILMKQDNGVVSNLYNKGKEFFDTELSLTNVEEALFLQDETAENLYKAKEGKLSKKEYFIQNREHLKAMMKRRLFRSYDDTGLDFLDKNRGNMTKEEFAQLIEKYINEQIDQIDNLDSLKNTQKHLCSMSEEQTEQILNKYLDDAKNEIIKDTMSEQSSIKIKKPDVLLEYDPTELMTFEETFKIERGREYSKEKVERYLNQKQKNDYALGAFNKYQTFKAVSDEFLKNYSQLATTTYGQNGVQISGVQPNPTEQANKIISLLTAYYENPINPDKAFEELEQLVTENNLPVTVSKNDTGEISIDLSQLNGDIEKNQVLNKLLRLETDKLKCNLENILGGDIDSTINEISKTTEYAYNSAYGTDFANELVQKMADDNKTFIQKYTGDVSTAGMVLTVVGGILCLTPAAPLGAGLVAAGNTLAIGGMVAKSGLGFTEALTRNNLDEEEIKELSKSLVMDAGGFVVGIAAGKVGMKAFNKLIDQKLAEVFKTEMLSGNRINALKQVFTNPAYLKNFMQAAGVKLSSDFIISYAGDLAMMGVLDTNDDWMSLLKSNLIGIAVGMSGDIKDLGDVSRYSILKEKELSGTISAKEIDELSTLRTKYSQDGIDMDGVDKTFESNLQQNTKNTETTNSQNDIVHKQEFGLSKQETAQTMEKGSVKTDAKQLNIDGITINNTGKYTPEIEQSIKKLFKKWVKDNNSSEYHFKALFDNIKNLDYENLDLHLKNIKTLFGCKFNSLDIIVSNGYFNSKEGAEAFAILEKNYSTVPICSDYISPIADPLATYTAEQIIKANDRGIINNLDNSERVKKLCGMTDEEFNALKIKTAEDIKNSGYTYEQLHQQLLQKLDGRVNDYFVEYINEETVLGQIKMLEVLDNQGIELKKDELSGILSKVNNICIDAQIEVLNKLNNKEVASTNTIRNFIGMTNDKTKSILCELLDMKDVSPDIINKYCSNDDFISGKVSKAEIVSKIDSDPYIRTIRAINSNDIDIRPQNTNPTTLDPRNITASSLALVHMTKYEPENGKILSTRDKIGGSRNSVHFTLNHAVSSHYAGDWDDCKYAIIMPYESAVKQNTPHKFIEGMPNDLYTDGSVTIPEGSVIIKYNNQLEKGTINITTDKNLSGVKIIETSIHPHDIVPTVIEKMGYSHLQGDGLMGVFSYGKNNGNSVDSAFENYKAWETFCNKNNIKITNHTASPGGVAEKLIENIDKLCPLGKWRYEGRNYKKEILDIIEKLKPWTDKGYFVSFDLDTLYKIVEQSITPKGAKKRIEKELGFSSSLDRREFNQCSVDMDFSIYEKWLNAVESDEKLKEYFAKDATL